MKPTSNTDVIYIVAYNGRPYWLLLNVLSITQVEFGVFWMAGFRIQSLYMTNTKKHFFEFFFSSS